MEQQVKKTEHDGLPFITSTYTKRGRLLTYNGFDVSAASYDDGWLKGMETAAQLMDALKEGREDFNLSVVIEDAVKASIEERGSVHSGRRGAADGFLSMIEAMLRGAARDYGGAWIRKHRDEQAQWLAEHEARREAQRQERNRTFAARMKAAKQAKRHAAGVRAAA